MPEPSKSLRAPHSHSQRYYITRSIIRAMFYMTISAMTIAILSLQLSP